MSSGLKKEQVMSVVEKSATSVEERLNAVLEVARRHAGDVDAAARFPSESVAELRATGLLGLTVPAEHGGLGAGPVQFAEVVSRLAEACGSTAMVYLMHVSAVMPVLAGLPAGLPGLARQMAEQKLGTLAFSERGSRSHFWAPVSKSTARGDSVQMRADKSFVTSAGHADVYVASVLTPDASGPLESDLYAIPADTPGLKVGAPWRGLGLRGNASSPIEIDAVVPIANRLGGPAGGFKLMMEVVLPWFNLGNAAVSIGLCRAALKATVTHAGGARLDHLGESLADLPTIRAQLARMQIAVDSSDAYLRAAAASVAAPDDGTSLKVLSIKAAANDTALTVTDAAMRVCGGAAFSGRLGVDRVFRDARAGHVMAPTADVLYDFIGKAITGQALF
jgi:alkylation response protein AidB-like acyl-CoA dehydrogenase